MIKYIGAILFLSIMQFFAVCGFFFILGIMVCFFTQENILKVFIQLSDEAFLSNSDIGPMIIISLISSMIYHHAGKVDRKK